MKRLSILTVLALAMVFAGCAKAPSPETTLPAVSTTPTTAAQTVAPLAAAVSDAGTAVSFAPEDIAADETGQISITLTLYDFEHFSAAEIEALAPGDKLILEGTELEVATVEWVEGVVTVNGDPENGGVSLMADAFGQYFQLLDPYAESYPRYYAIGTRTLPLAGDFEFSDSSDLEQGEQVYDAAGFAALAPTGDPLSTMAITDGDAVVSISRRYIP